MGLAANLVGPCDPVSAWTCGTPPCKFQAFLHSCSTARVQETNLANLHTRGGGGVEVGGKLHFIGITMKFLTNFVLGLCNLPHPLSESYESAPDTHGYRGKAI